jgi:hypothetical protein
MTKKPKKSVGLPVILSVVLSCILIAVTSVCFALGLFHRHEPGAAATCTEAQICTKCNKILASAKGHIPGKEATCTEAQTCAVCNAQLEKALGHRPATGVTCTEAQFCAVCNEQLEEALGHVPGAEATCTDAQNCAVCNAQLVPALGHMPGAEASCTDAQTCSVCNAVLAEALGHMPGAEATCTDAQTCSVCNAELEEALGHTPGEWVTVTPPTETENGLRAQYCTRCGNLVKEETVSIGSEGLSYSKNSDGTYTVTGMGTCTDANVVIPASYNGSPVTGIDSFAFFACNGLTSIMIPSGVTSIGTNPFWLCGNLEEISVSESNAFYSAENGVLFNKEKTKLISYPAGKTETSYAVPEGVTEIADESVRACENLTAIVLPDSLRSIGTSAFRDCSNLTELVIPENVSSVGYWSLIGCAALTAISVNENNPYLCSENGVLYNKAKTELICYPRGKTDIMFVMPESVTEIRHAAVEGCAYLMGAVISDGVTVLNESVFRNCSNLMEIVIPTSVTVIGAQVFEDCEALSSVGYGGTVAQWKAIAFDANWDKNTGNYTVICTDGTVSK